MDPLKDFEALNAQEWDAASSIAVVPPSTAPPGLLRYPSLAQNTSTPSRIFPPKSHEGTAAGQLQRPAFRIPTPRKAGEHPDYTPKSGRMKPKAEWAKSLPLITNRKERDLKNKALISQNRQKYIDPPEEGEEFPRAGYYLWPSKDENAMDLLGWRLEDLDSIRINHQVWIEWHDMTRSLKVSSQSIQHGHRSILAAIKSIKLAVKNAKAQAISASTFWNVIPPTVNAMSSIVRPRNLYDGRASSTELAGTKLTDVDKLKWKTERSTMYASNYNKLKEHLTKSLRDLAHYRGWMRMRVHFGHVVFTQYRQDFADSKFNFADLVEMIGRARTTAYVDRKLEDVSIAMKMKQKIFDCPLNFHPVRGQIDKLEDVPFRDMVVFFVTTPDHQNIRIEADVDKILEGESSTEYQIGQIRMLHNNQRNKRMEITTLDIERQVDWSLEIISDNSIPEMPPALIRLIQGSIFTKSRTNLDPLGLPYSQISLKGTLGIDITSVVMRSVIQYKITGSGYIVEIAIYREWQGSNTLSEPKMAASVSMFHQAWDLEMELLDETAKERDWDDLSTLFADGAAGEGSGLREFLTEVESIQGLLSAAS